tara:strand:- start:2000 stop:3898 length:1899 start_codon:yes stop_codon:yes gene_type:complete
MSKCTILRSAAAIALFACSSVFAQPEGYMSNDDLTSRLNQIATNDHASLSSIGTSLGGAPLHLLSLSEGEGERPAILIVAGIDAEYLVGTEVATRIAEELLEHHSSMLKDMTVYIVPRANPDGAARNMGKILSGHSGNARLVDEDRDRMLDEDHADDLNGDGIITMMRRLEPTLNETPSHLADLDDPRLNVKPDKSEGQRAVFTLYTEGLDNDGDGQINEDGFGAVDINMNFMHRWPEHDPHAGRYALSEPEAYALARFVLDHDDIVAAVTIGKHDNLINQPDAKKKDITSRSPLEIDAGDADLYKEAGAWFKDAVAFASAEKHDSAGSFHAWLYAQRGLPSFAVHAWARPDESESKGDRDDKPAPKPEQADDEPQLTPSPVGDISMETLEELREAYTQMTGEEPDETMISQITPEMVEQFAAQLGIEVRRVKEQESPAAEMPESDKNKSNKKKLSEDAKWLKYFEEAGIDGFVDWQPLEHPTLGKVEIGGFIPGAKINPPASLLDELAEKHTDFVTRVIEAQADIEVLGPEIEEIGGGLYEVHIVLQNNGELSTTTSFSRTTRSVKPVIVRLSVPVDQVIRGQRVDRVWGIEGNGGRSAHTWLFRTDDINNETITIDDPRFGKQVIKLSGN